MWTLHISDEYSLFEDEICFQNFKIDVKFKIVLD